MKFVKHNPLCRWCCYFWSGSISSIRYRTQTRYLHDVMYAYICDAYISDLDSHTHSVVMGIWLQAVNMFTSCEIDILILISVEDGSLGTQSLVATLRTVFCSVLSLKAYNNATIRNAQKTIVPAVNWKWPLSWFSHIQKYTDAIFCKQLNRY